MNLYGAKETNPLPEGFHEEQPVCMVNWDSPDLARVERLRLLSDPGFPFWDVSYCTGRLKNGQKCDVQLPFSQIPKRPGINSFIISEAKREGVYAKGLGIFDVISTLI